MIIKTGCVICLLSLPALCCGAEGERTVATVNGTAITEQQVQAAVAQKLPWSSFHKTMSEETAQKLRDEAMESLIDNELVYQDAQKQVTIADSEVQDEFEKSRKGFKTEEEFAGALKKASLSEDGLKADLRRKLMISRMTGAAIIRPSQVSEAEAGEHFEKNREKYQEPEKMKLREIFIQVPANATNAEREEKRKKAEAVLSKIKAGGDFGLLAWDHSEDKYKYKSGEIGYIHEGMLDPEIEKAVMQLKPGETTEIIGSIYGYYLFYLEEKTAARQLSFADVKDKLMKQLSEKKEKELRQAYLMGLRNKAEIRRY